MLILQHWVAGRVRTPGRFWRTVRRIDARSVDLITIWIRLIIVALCALCMFAMSGCANYGRVELEHVSHPFAGFPVSPRTDEDALNQFNVCLGNDRGWFAEACTGYVIGDSGFFGPRLSFTARVGKRFNFGDRQ